MPETQKFKEQVEEDPEEGATGRRWAICLVMIALGIAAVVVGFLLPATWLSIGGFVTLVLFGLVAAGSDFAGISFKNFNFGARFQKRVRRRTKTVETTNLPKHGPSPADKPADRQPVPPTNETSGEKS